MEKERCFVEKRPGQGLHAGRGDFVRRRGRILHRWVTSIGVLSGLLFLSVLGCNEPAERTVVPPSELPQEKNVLTAYHPAEFLTTEVVSAPLLTEKNHPHGWQQANCIRCHRVPDPSLDPQTCTTCHGQNGVHDQEDTCASCHRVTNPRGAPDTGQHLAHVQAGPRDEQCLECHPGRNSNVHANGIVNVVFKQGGTFTPDDQGGTCEVACHEPRPWGGEGCRGCHGFPPETGVHRKHLEQKDITCRDCHRDNQHDDDKNSGSIDVGGVQYNSITGECTSACHDKTEVWNCTSCHGYPPSSGNHDPTTHDLRCDACHQGHKHSYMAATQPKNFSNVMVRLAQGGTYQDNTPDGLANGTCSGTGCHEPRAWGTDCSSCHAYPPTSGYHIQHVIDEQNQCQDCHQGNQHDDDVASGAIEVGGVTYNALSGGCISQCHEPKRWECQECHGYPPASGNHLAHASEKLACKECHADHEHSFKMAMDAFDLSGVSVKFAQGGQFDAASKQCSTPCHEDRVWGSTCSDCHGNPPDTGYHRLHVAAGAKCDTCHAGRQHDLDTTSGFIDIGGIEYQPFTGDCTSNCHTGTIRWDCTSCHGYPPETGAHTKHAVELQLACSLCHQGHRHDYRAAQEGLQEFKPVKVDFTIRGQWDGKTCTNIGCHGDRPWE